MLDFLLSTTFPDKLYWRAFNSSGLSNNTRYAKENKGDYVLAVTAV